MFAYRLGQHAVGDLRSISDWIATHNQSAALRWLETMEGLFSLLGTQPEMGERCDEVRPGLRRITSGNYVVYFRYTTGVPEIIRIVHGARDLDKLP